MPTATFTRSARRRRRRHRERQVAAAPIRLRRAPSPSSSVARSNWRRPQANDERSTRSSRSAGGSRSRSCHAGSRRSTAGRSRAPTSRPARSAATSTTSSGSATEGACIGLVVADVTGKGIPAAILMADTRGLIHAAADHSDDPAETLARVNRILVDERASGLFVTVAHAVLDTRHRPPDPRPGRPRPAPSPAGRRPARGPRAAGPPDRDGRRPRPDLVELALEPGDAFVGHTDGVTEARSADGSFYGEDRFRALLTSLAGMPAAGIVDAVVADVAAFRGRAEPSDDLTLLVVRRQPLVRRRRTVRDPSAGRNWSSRARLGVTPRSSNCEIAFARRLPAAPVRADPLRERLPRGLRDPRHAAGDAERDRPTDIGRPSSVPGPVATARLLPGERRRSGSADDRGARPGNHRTTVTSRQRPRAPTAVDRSPPTAAEPPPPTDPEPPGQPVETGRRRRPRQRRREASSAARAEAAAGRRRGAPPADTGGSRSAGSRSTEARRGRRRFALPPLDDDHERVSRSIETFLGGIEAADGPTRSRPTERNRRARDRRDHRGRRAARRRAVAGDGGGRRRSRWSSGRSAARPAAPMS